MRMPIRSLVLLVLGTAVLIETSCSNRVPKPTAGKNSSNAAPETDGEPDSDGGPHDSVKAPSTVDTVALRTTSEPILAPTNSSCSATTASAGVTPYIRLLTRVEYNNTIADLFGITKDVSGGIPAEKNPMGFKNNALTNNVDDGRMSAYMDAAKAIATEVTATTLPNLAGCVITAGESCATIVINKLGPKIWRRAITKEESTRLLALFKTGAAGGNEAGFQLLLRGFLSSSNFLYRTEIGASGNLTAQETAHALSYFFWSSIPDDELRKLADSGDILKPATLLAQANRLLASPKTKNGIREFAEAYLQYQKFMTIQKDTTKYPQFTNEVRDAMKAEAENTMDYWIRSKSIKFEDLFAADYSVGSAALGNYYGATSADEGGTQVLHFTAQKRRGILGLGSVMASLATQTETNPIKRGAYIREHILCDILPQPTGLDIPAVVQTAGLSTRERFAAHSSNPQCAACHKLIDGVGFGMEDYDAVGLMRDNENGKPIDASGSMVGLDGKDVTFTGVDGLSAVLKNSERAKRCFVLQAFRSVNGRFEEPADVCSIRAVANEFVTKDTALSDVLIKVITNQNLLKRKGL